MNKDEFSDLFKDQLTELNEFSTDIENIKRLINLIIENYDLLKDDTTDEQIGEVSSDINIKISKINSLIKDILSDSKKLKAFIHEIKLLKRKREKKLGKSDKKETTTEFERLLKDLKEREISKNKIIPNPNQYPIFNPNPTKNPFNFT